MSQVFITEPINIVTGALGSGKTLFAIEQADLLRKSGQADVVYQVGINGPDTRHLPHLPFPLEEWYERADAGELKNAVIIVDEFHKWMPQRSHSQRPPKHVEEMAETRRRDVRWILITQSGEFDHFLKGTRLNRHFYLSRKSGLGRSTIYEWMNRFVSNPEENEAARKVAIRHLWSHRGPVKKYGTWYESAKAHRFKPRLPLRAKLALLFIPVALFFVYRGVSGVGNMLDGGLNVPVPAALEAMDDLEGAGYSLPSGSVEGRQFYTEVSEYIKQFQPLHGTLPWSAPAWQGRAVASDPQIYCMQSLGGLNALGEYKEPSCSCWSEQMTRLHVEQSHCETIVRDGIYNPYKPPIQATAGRGGGEADGKPTWSARPPADASPVSLHSARRGGRTEFGDWARYGDMGIP